MHVTLVQVAVKPQDVVKFIEACRLNHEQSVREPGNCRFDILQSADDPTRFILYEAYESAEAAQAHKKTPHYLQWRDTVAEMMAEPRRGLPFHGLYPSGKCK